MTWNVLSIYTEYNLEKDYVMEVVLKYDLQDKFDEKDNKWI